VPRLIEHREKEALLIGKNEVVSKEGDGEPGSIPSGVDRFLDSPERRLAIPAGWGILPSCGGYERIGGRGMLISALPQLPARLLRACKALLRADKLPKWSNDVRLTDTLGQSMQAYESSSSQRASLESIALTSSVIRTILAEWHAIGLPDLWLVAGAVAQTVWNHAFGFPADHGIKDVDLVYFDQTDLSERGERHHAARVGRLFKGLSQKFDVKNQARVHLWYEAKFGIPLAQYRSATHAIATFPTTATSIGVRPDPSGLEVEAPYGLADLFALVVRPNKTLITRSVYEAKIQRWRPLWPDLNIHEWS
jgi:uncharacterized protein